MLNRTGRISFNPDELLTNSLSGQLVTVFTMFDVVMLYVIMGYLAWSKDSKANIERQPTFLPKRPPSGFRLYAILLETGQSPAGGTTSQVFLRMCGKLTTSPAFTLTCTSEQQRGGGNRRLFASQNKDLFILALPHYLGGIDAFEVVTDRRGECPPWFLRSIRAMCLDNRKCWKSKVGAWLRGDKKPYHIKADIIGALSTKEYLKKVLQLNHTWIFPWYRSLGSSFTSLQRWAIHWASIGLGLGLVNYLLYDEAILQNLDQGRVTTPHFNASQIAVAGIAGAAGGVVLSSLLRLFARLDADGSIFPQVDDKDDFAHLHYDLDYAQGAVVCSQQSPFDECLAQLQLTPGQIRHLKHITECGVSDCNLKSQLHEPKCPQDADCCYSRPAATDEEMSHSDPDQAYGDNNSSFYSASPMEAHKRGFRASIEDLKEGLHEDDEGSSEGSDENMGTRLTSFLRKLWGGGSEMQPQGSAGTATKTAPKKKAKNLDMVPTVSARIISSSDSLTSLDSPLPIRKSNASVSRAADEYDSLSEGESDQELATRSAKTDSEIDLLRRPVRIYDIAPKWNDRLRVWVQSSEGGNEHFRLLYGRYSCTSGSSDCCLRRKPMPSLKQAVMRYLEEEKFSPDGRVFERWRFIATSLCALSAFLGVLAVAYSVYQRWFLPNADTLIYLYAVLLMMVLHPIFATADAFLWALLASWRRRSRILSARNENARRLYEPQDSSLFSVVTSDSPGSLSQ